MDRKLNLQVCHGLRSLFDAVLRKRGLTNSNDRQDVIQDMLTRLFVAVQDSTKMFAASLAWTCLNSARIDFFRRRRTYERHLESYRSSGQFRDRSDDRTSGLADEIEAKEMVAILTKDLSQSEFHLLQLYMQDVPNYDIAKLLGVSPGNASRRVEKMLAELRLKSHQDN